jgi:hypothetical protein
MSLQAQELLSNISILEGTISKLEDDMVSLHFQLIQERNERRLVEYRLKQAPPPPQLQLQQPRSVCSCHSTKSESDVWTLFSFPLQYCISE